MIIQYVRLGSDRLFYCIPQANFICPLAILSHLSSNATGTESVWLVPGTVEVE